MALTVRQIQSSFHHLLRLLERILKMAIISDLLLNHEPIIDSEMEKKFLGIGEEINSNQSSSSDIPKDIERTDDINMKINFDQDCKSRNLKNEADVIAKRLLENKLAISLCQNLSYYSIITNKKPSRK